MLRLPMMKKRLTGKTKHQRHLSLRHRFRLVPFHLLHIPVSPVEPVEQIGLVVVDVLSVYVITDLVQIYFPFSHAGGVVLQEPPTKELEEVDR